MLFFLIFIQLSTSHLRSFDPQRMRLVDVYQPGDSINYLYRSGSPLTNNLKHFNWTGIVDTMQKLANKKGINFPQIFSIYDISLLNPHIKNDKICLKIEKHFFKKGLGPNHLHSGMTQNLILGETFSPDSIKNITKRKHLALNYRQWSKDDLPNFVAYLESAIETDYGEPTVYLVHCMKGVDRTGEVIGGYEMLRFGKTLKEVVREDTMINKGNSAPKKENYNALLWYEMCLKEKSCY